MNAKDINSFEYFEEMTSDWSREDLLRRCYDLCNETVEKQQELEMLYNNWSKLEKFILDWNDVILISTVKTKMGSGYFEGAYITIHKILDKMKELKGSGK